MTGIPFNKPKIQGQEIENILDSIRRGKISGDGHYTEKCQVWMQDRLGAPKALLTHSCTAALEMAAILIGLEAGDEVIMPSFTFVSTANAVCLRQAVPVFVDIDPVTLNISPKNIEAAITDKTKAIFVVHYAGVVCEMDEIMKIAKQHSLIVVEDAAQALCSTYNGKPAGTFGAFSAFSFHETKNIISGEGGALIINDETYIDRAEIIREKGTNRSLFFRGAVDKYTWVDIGSSFLPSDIIAAFLYGQFDKADTITDGRRAVWHRYDNELASLLNAKGIRTPKIPDYCTHNAHIYYLIFDSIEKRDHFRSFMSTNGVLCPFHYVPLHSAPAGEKYGRTHGELTSTNDVSDGLVRLPMFTMAPGECTQIIDTVKQYIQTL